MGEKREKILFFLFLIALFSYFIFIPLHLSKNDIFLGGDAVGVAGTVEQVFIKLRKGETNFFDIFLWKGILFNDISWPEGFYLPPNIATGINVVLRFFFPDEISAYTATLILFEILNVLSIFFILKKVLNINFFLSIFFSTLTIFFPYFYHRLHHQNLVAFWQELLLIYFVLKFTDNPNLKYVAYTVLFIFINIFFNIQTCYFLFLSFAPAIIIATIYRLKSLKINRNRQVTADSLKTWCNKIPHTPPWGKGGKISNQKPWGLNSFVPWQKFWAFWSGIKGEKKDCLNKFFIYSFFIIVSALIIFNLSPYKNKSIIFNGKEYKKNILPERDKKEIEVWKAPAYYLFLPTDTNILFGKISGKKFKSKWGYHEKAIYLGILFLFFYFILIFRILKNFKTGQIKKEFLSYNFRNFFLITGFFIFLFSVFWAIAPALKFENILYFFNKSARVYARAIGLAIVFWVIIFAFLLDYSIKNGLIKISFAIIIVFLISLDIFPKSFKQLILKLERCPEEYVFLSNIGKDKEILLDYFGRYGGYAEYGYLIFKKCHKLVDLDATLVDNKWDEELYNVLKEFKVSYILFFKKDKEKNINETKIRKFIKNFKLKAVFENKRSIIAFIP